MKCHWILNGKIQLAITAESEIEKQMLLELSKGDLDNQWYDKLQIADKALVDTMMLSPKTAPAQG